MISNETQNTELGFPLISISVKPCYLMSFKATNMGSYLHKGGIVFCVCLFKCIVNVNVKKKKKLFQSKCLKRWEKTC